MWFKLNWENSHFGTSGDQQRATSASGPNYMPYSNIMTWQHGKIPGSRGKLPEIAATLKPCDRLQISLSANSTQSFSWSSTFHHDRSHKIWDSSPLFLRKKRECSNFTKAQSLHRSRLLGVEKRAEWSEYEPFFLAFSNPGNTEPRKSSQPLNCAPRAPEISATCTHSTPTLALSVILSFPYPSSLTQRPRSRSTTPTPTRAPTHLTISIGLIRARYG